ncbi:aldehyde dehydrogenase family protein [Bifidobacterium sp. LC6]|uniref:Aldehyde dehydrogenase family protein n=2 Tax=Bifidobacterium TaxID=1678 RepID=A0A2N5ITN5_9BIFI|nr:MULTISPECIES: aldehyde dehydrogenase family protein [Bifidobacterium]MBT1174661.1 aldehyde dehydrogenase family protein [Bifidobacterium colobi]PLS25326.1 NAD-dependent aldehyde dehydrogenase [Bifidobacterium imperatoris]QSY57915.1 aldehyde dehydrogenase family protein [Bifidobacterium imperatoris]
MRTINMYINGHWVESASGKVTEIINPANGSTFAQATRGTAEDVNMAVAAAKQAFKPGSLWRHLTADERAELLNKAADLIEARAEELALAETNSMGRVYKETRYDDVYAASGAFRYYASLVHELQGAASAENVDMLTVTVREPLGVCAVVAPWNYSMGTLAAGMAPALAAGNTVVIKPSSLTPVSTAMMVEAMEEAGFPAGSVNMVLGSGSEVGSALAQSEDVAKITFTGGTATGKDIIAKSSTSVKRYAMELGGKSPFIIFDDADLDVAVDRLMFGIFLSQGQVCIAGSRLLVQSTIYEQVMHMLEERIPKIRIGMPLDEDTEFGPMVSKRHMEHVLEYIEIGKAEGAKVLIGGHRITKGDFAKGYFIEPTVLVNCNEHMRVVSEEIFGPVLTVQTFSDEAEAVRLANSTSYGLAGGVFTRDMGRALRVCTNVNTGIMWANTYMDETPGVPVSPHKQSGTTVDGGLDGLKEYTVLKQINLKMSPEKSGWFNS